MATKIIASSELMTNYMQGDIISPDKKFISLQSDKGHSLLFSIGTDDVFYLTEELPGSNTGWQRSDLSSALTDFFEEGSRVIAKTFAVDQNSVDNGFSAVLIVTVGDFDYLFVASQYQKKADGNIMLDWVKLPFDIPGEENTGIHISDVYLLQTEKAPLIIVNTVPAGKSTLERYYIDSTKALSDTVWNLYTLPLNMDSEGAQLCGGRKAGEKYVDGIYSLGNISGIPNLYYQQIFNPFEPEIGGVTSLLILPDAWPESMASTGSAVVQDAAHNYTDLYVSSTQGDLYLFAANNQDNKAEGLKLMNHELFVSTVRLYAYTIDQQVVVWGLNRSNQVFYTECEAARVTDPAAWSYPVPLAAGVEQIAPYKNRVNGGNTYFMHTGAGTLKKAVQDPASTSWTVQDIMLAVDKQAPSQKCDCYMTRLTVCDDQNVPVNEASLSISSAYRVPVQINGLYYVLDTVPVKVTADAQGAVKLVQRADNLQGARLWVQSEDSTEKILVNPMNNAVAKVGTLNTGEALQKAQITDDKGQPVKPLVGAGVSGEDLDAAAASIQSLVNAYNNYNIEQLPSAKRVSGGIQQPRFAFNPAAKMYTLALRPTGYEMKVVDSVGDAISDIADAIVVAAGDLCSWLANAAEYVIQIIEDTVEKVWNFVATVAGKVYTFVINTVEKAIAALEAVFNFLKTLIEDLIQFLKFLFSWDDIKRTNDMYVNIIKISMDFGVEKIGGMKGGINDGIAGLIETINSAAGVTAAPDADWLNEPLSYQQSKTDYSTSYTAANTYLQDHFLNNIANGQFKVFNGPVGNLASLAMDILLPLVDALKREGKMFEMATGALNNQLFKNDQYKTMSVGEILKVLMVILTDTLLASVANILDLLIDIIVEVFDDCIALLTEPIWIPVLSDILYGIWGYEIEWSLLDIICLIGSVPGTLIYKLSNDAAPFTADDGYSTQIIEATSMEDLIQAFGSAGNTIDYSKELYSIVVLPETFKNVFFIASHFVSGTASLIKAPLILAEDILELPSVPLISPAKDMCGLVVVAGSFAAGEFARPYPIANGSVATLATGLSVCSFASKLIFAAMGKIAGAHQKAKWGLKEIGAAVDLVLSLTSAAPIAYHFTELAEVPANQFRNLAIVDDTAKLAGYASNIADDIAKFDPEPTTSTVTAVASLLLALINGGLQYGESFTAPD